MTDEGDLQHEQLAVEARRVEGMLQRLVKMPQRELYPRLCAVPRHCDGGILLGGEVVVGEVIVREYPNPLQVIGFRILLYNNGNERKP